MERQTLSNGMGIKKIILIYCMYCMYCVVVIAVVMLAWRAEFITDANGSKTSAAPEAKSEQTAVTEMTVGNHTWIPFDTYLIVNKNDPAAIIVLSLLDKFEKRHPELELIHSYPVYRIEDITQGAIVHIFGIWVDHRPKTK